MEDQAHFQQLLKQYLASFPAELERLRSFRNFVKMFDGPGLYDRKNFAGHITSSAFILNEEQDKLLVIKHHFLERWLQPGGHVELSDDNLLSAALREAEEETGIAAAGFTPLRLTPFDFDSHPIPANRARNEEPHVHHDARFLFTCRESLTNPGNEDLRWISVPEALASVDLGAAVKKIITRL